jgi:two-component response regulator (ARR-A family)
MEVTAAGSCCRGRDDHAAGEEERSSSAKDAQVVVPVGGDGAEVVEPCVIAVDDSSVDRALVTALLRRSKYRGEEDGYASKPFLLNFFLIRTNE